MSSHGVTDCSVSPHARCVSQHCPSQGTEQHWLHLEDTSTFLSLLPPGEWHFSHPGVRIPLNCAPGHKQSKRRQGARQLVWGLHTHHFLPVARSFSACWGQWWGQEEKGVHAPMIWPLRYSGQSWFSCLPGAGCDKPTLAFRPLPLDVLP